MSKGETTHQIWAKPPTGKTTEGETIQGETTQGRNDSRANIVHSIHCITFCLTAPSLVLQRFDNMYLSLLVHSGPLKRIWYSKRYSLANSLILNVFSALRELTVIFYLLSLQLVLCCVAALKSSPIHRP